MVASTKILSSISIGTLNKHIADAIALGYKPVGDPQLATVAMNKGSVTQYIQRMEKQRGFHIPRNLMRRNNYLRT